MTCTTCGMQLPANAKTCPRCGTPTPLYYSDTGSPQIDSTVPAGPYNTPPGPTPSTTYGSNPYATQPQNPYEVAAPPPPPPPQSPYPYNVIPPSLPPSQPPPRSNMVRVGLIIGVGLLVVVLIGAGLFALFRPNTSSSSNSTPTVSTTQAAANTTATAIANASQNPYAPHTGVLILNDPLKDNSKGYKWDESSFSNGDTCGFTNGAYHIVEKEGLICIPEAPQFTLSNFAFEVNITVVSGDNGGIAFRIDQVNKTFYDFDITTNGAYTLKVYNGKYTTLSQGTNSVIKKGLNQANLLAVVANGDLITIYVNNQIIDSVHDKTFSQGQIGVVSFGDNGPTNVIASDARAWKL